MDLADLITEKIQVELEDTTEVERWEDPGDYPNNRGAAPLPPRWDIVYPAEGESSEFSFDWDQFEDLEVDEYGITDLTDYKDSFTIDGVYSVWKFKRAMMCSSGLTVELLCVKAKADDGY